jgi:hypothetical protein
MLPKREVNKADRIIGIGVAFLTRRLFGLPPR